MNPASRTPEGWPNHCPVCGEAVTIDPSLPPGDATCPRCGCLLWFDSRWLDELDFLVPEACMADLGQCTKEKAIRRMVESLAESGAIPVGIGEDVTELVLKREQVGTTGIRRGFAVPHAKHPNLKRVVGCLAHSSHGIDFDSFDGEPVHLVILLLSPADQLDVHMRAVREICRWIVSQQTTLP